MHEARVSVLVGLLDAVVGRQVVFVAGVAGGHLHGDVVGALEFLWGVHVEDEGALGDSGHGAGEQVQDFLLSEHGVGGLGVWIWVWWWLGKSGSGYV